MTAILKAPVDLLWNGGIGTYVKAASESNADVGDRANNSIRVDGRDLRCKVVGEGGNLGMSHLGRVEAALNGVLLNTAIAHARDPLLMARAMRAACDAGRWAYQAGRIPRRLRRGKRENHKKDRIPYG